MPLLILPYLFFTLLSGHAATIAIIDTGFDLDHNFLKPKLMRAENDETPVSFMGVDLTDNTHLKTPVVEDQKLIQDILQYRSLKAKGHREGLSLTDFEWFKEKAADKDFMEKVKLFRRHSHGTFVAGIALREGENINIFPIRGLGLPNPVVAIEDSTPQVGEPIKGKTPEERFREEISNSLSRVSRKFAKICSYISKRDIQVVNASYGITYKSIIAKFREKHKEIVGTEIDESRLQVLVNEYFQELYKRGERTIKKYPRILFVFSAGNSGLDNDLYHHYPSRIKLPNTISVAAMNGDYLASFSNYGHHVDIGAPGVAIQSLLPKVYTEGGTLTYSPASGTSMAAPYISNLAAQILNTNPRLSPPEIKKIILSTGDEKLHLKPRLYSGSVVSNEKAIRAAQLSREVNLNQAVVLAQSNLMPFADSSENLKQKVLDTIPQAIAPHEVDEEPTVAEVSEVTRSESSSLKHQDKELPDSLVPLPSESEDLQEKPSDQAPSSQTSIQSPPLSVEMPASSSESELPHLEAQSQESSPSLPL